MSNPSLPDVIEPEYARQWQALRGILKGWLRQTPGIIGAWLPPAGLHDSNTGSQELIIPVLVEDGHEQSVALETVEGVGLACLSVESLELLLETDHELARDIAGGYRLCGGDPEFIDIENLAKQVAGEVSY